MNQTIVISAISIRMAGMLSILVDCLKELESPKYSGFKIYAIVKDRSLVEHVNPAVTYIQIDGTRSYVHRLYYEYFYFRKISKQLKPFLWLSLHDVTPRVKADRRAVYCHNPAPFYKVSWREFLIEPKFALFNLVYLIFYRINIKRNKYTIVQQAWLRDEFAAIFGLRKEDIIVARPEGVSQSEVSRPKMDGVKRFIFPALPRVWKNFEVIGEAVTILNARGVTNFEVMWTLSGDENKYASWLKQQYAGVRGIHFMGRLTRSRLFEVYGEVDCLIFPSKLESWGLPISEFKNFNKAILLADLPYAHETMGNYDKVSFFSPSSAADLAERMIGIIEGKGDFDGNTLDEIHQPYAKNWDALFNILLAP